MISKSVYVCVCVLMFVCVCLLVHSFFPGCVCCLLYALRSMITLYLLG